MPTLANAAPFPYTFPRERVALVVIDMQRDFLEPGGFGATLGNNVSLLHPIISPLQALIAAFRKHHLPIIHTRECHRPDLSDCAPAKLLRGNPGMRIGDAGPMGRILISGEPGADIIPDLYPAAGETVIDKPGKGSFYGTDLAAILSRRHVSHLVVCGVTTEVCVQTTLREANDRGYECLLVEDCTESYFPEFKKATLEMVRAQGAIVGWTATSREVINALDAKTGAAF
jgi:nicotinamidase-related amidase